MGIPGERRGNSYFPCLRSSRAENECGCDPYEGKNPAAVELGRLGGKKGGKARAEKMTPKQRSVAAKKAAKARWEGHNTSP
jgi:hypothetical protein